MIKIFFLFALLFVGGVSAQDKNVITVEISKIAGQERMTLKYFTLQDMIDFPKLPTGKHRIYIQSDENCKPSLVTDRGFKLSEEESQQINAILSRHRMEFFEDKQLVPDCKKYATRVIPITIAVE